MFDFSIITLGCKVNKAESNTIADALTNSGFGVSFDFAIANNYIINTCSVTSEADSKSRQTIAKVLKLNSSANIFIVGCSSEFDPSVYNNPNIKLVAGTKDRGTVIDKILGIVGKCDNNKVDSQNSIVAKSSTNAKSLTTFNTRAILKVQDGCDRFCSYCIVPYLRGRSVSRSLDDILAEANELAKSTKEILLSGICLSDFKIGNKNALVDLIKVFGTVAVQRKRIGSLHPDSITNDLLTAMVDSGFCDHIHLSIQSGSDAVLKRMNRHYTAKEVLEKIDLIRRVSPECGITTDIIAGFSGETEDEFNETAKFLKLACFSDAHIFAYSERSGTKAVNLEQVDKKIRNERAKLLKEIATVSKKQFINSQLGKSKTVLVENNNTGYTTNYIKVKTNNAPQNSITTITLTTNNVL